LKLTAGTAGIRRLNVYQGSIPSPTGYCGSQWPIYGPINSGFV